MIAVGMGDVVLIGSMHSIGTLRIKEFLTRNGHPYSYIDLDHDHKFEIVPAGKGVCASVSDPPASFNLSMLAKNIWAM
ncbi:MAG: hypothetical protein WCC17_00955 [Candidatus Nitrosopolaris sp.]